MTFWRFDSPDDTYLRTQGTLPDFGVAPLRGLRIANDVLQGYEAVRRGLRTANATDIEVEVFGDNRREGTFTRTKVKTQSADGTRETDVTLFDAGLRNRQVLIDQRVEREVLEEVAREEQAKRNTETTQFNLEPTIEQDLGSPDVLPEEPEYRAPAAPQIPAAQLAAQLAAEAQAAYEAGQVGSTPAANPGDFAGSGQPPGGNYDPNFIPSHVTPPPPPGLEGYNDGWFGGF